MSYTSTNASILYLTPIFSVNLGYALHGGAPGSLASEVVESVMIQSTNKTPLALWLFAYSDFDLAGVAEGDATVSFPSTNGVLQEGNGTILTQLVRGPTPNYWEASWYPIILYGLEGNSPVTLSDELIPPEPGDQTFAYQWYITLGAGQTFAVYLTNSIRSEPNTNSLTIAVLESNVVISWPTNVVAGAQLQTTSVLGAAANWTAVTNSPTTVNGLYQLSVAPAGHAQYYRLKE